jgi:hypothetical protein
VPASAQSHGINARYHECRHSGKRLPQAARYGHAFCSAAALPHRTRGWDVTTRDPAPCRFRCEHGFLPPLCPICDEQPPPASAAKPGSVPGRVTRWRRAKERRTRSG